MHERQPRCLFCKVELGGSGQSAPHREHIIPQSLTGFSWLTTRDVCRRCNNTLGKDVDAIADSVTMQPFRLDAGISINHRAPASIIDPATGESVNGEVDIRTGKFYRRRKVQCSERNAIQISGHSLDEVMQIAKAEARRLAASGYLVDFGEPQYNPGFATVSTRDGSKDLEGLKRFAAKTAVEYISIAAGSHVALNPVFDNLRDSVLLGEAFPDVSVKSLVQAKAIWLPRARRSVWLHDSEPTAEQDRALKACERIEGSPSLERPHHSLRVASNGTSLLFQLKLFDVIVVQIAVNASSPLTWAAYDECDLLSKQRWSQR